VIRYAIPCAPISSPPAHPIPTAHSQPRTDAIPPYFSDLILPSFPAPPPYSSSVRTQKRLLQRARQSTALIVTTGTADPVSSAGGSTQLVCDSPPRVCLPHAQAQAQASDPIPSSTSQVTTAVLVSRTRLHPQSTHLLAAAHVCQVPFHHLLSVYLTPSIKSNIQCSTAHLFRSFLSRSHQYTGLIFFVLHFA